MSPRAPDPSDAYRDGWSAAYDLEAPVSACPFRPGTPDHTAWARGWTEATTTRRDMDGSMERETLAQRAQVRSQMAHLPEHRPDPVEEILASPDPSPRTFVWAADDDDAWSAAAWVAGPDYPSLESLAAAVQRVADALGVAFRTAAQVVIQSINSYVGLEERPRSLADAIQVDTKPLLERHRHGSAAVCPRHGPTKGGLCRKCR